MDVVEFDDPEEFWAEVGPLLSADPVHNTIAITVLAAIRAGRSAAPSSGATGSPGEREPMLLAVRQGGAVVGVAMCTPPYPVIVSGLPGAAAPAVVEHVLGSGRRAVGASGSRAEVDAFTAAWLAATGERCTVVMEQRLHRLGQLVPPAGVPGAATAATEADIPLLVRWTAGFAADVGAGDREVLDEERLRRLLAQGNARLLWRVDGEPVAFAGATAPRQGMSRIAPVYTPPEHRCRGYGSAVTAAVTAWALAAGARDAVLYTDLANPTANSIYRALGYRPVVDAREVLFTPA